MAKKNGSAVIDEDPSDEIPAGELETDGDDDEDEFAKFIDRSDPETTVVTFRGVKFAFPTARRAWPTRAMQAFQRQQHADGIELLFGPKQWDLFNDVAPTMGDFWEFIPLFAAASGFLKAA